MLLSVRDLAVRFETEDGFTYAVNGLNFDLASGETLGIVGESGCGKSVTSLTLMRLLPKRTTRIARGEIWFNGADLLGLSDQDMRGLRGKEIAMIFQDPMTGLNPVLTIGRQLTESFSAHQKISRAEAKARALALLGSVGIADSDKIYCRFPHQLSGGMRQRVMIAMALALAPKLLIADEPTTALDVTIQAQVLELMRDLTRSIGTAVILVTHDLGVVASMTQRVMVMYAGMAVEVATTEQIFAAPKHPYTIGLLHSRPRLDEGEQAELVPIEGAPPDQRRVSRGCPFAPRCAWRLPICTTERPDLMPVVPCPSETSQAGHRVACHNPATLKEAAAGRPLRSVATASC